ncbi:MAG: hypothetical protein WDZ56_00555 [Candidatus Paceibacterota bacterium]
MKNSSKRKVLFEIFIVMSVVTVAIVFIVKVSEEGREATRNVARVSQIQEYQKAFNLHYADTGTYPFDGKQTPTCLGSYAAKRCWHNGSLQESNLIVNSLMPKYMPRLSEVDTRKFGEGDAYTGIVYEPGAKGKSYKIFYFMEGEDQSCIIDKAIGSASGHDTLCILEIP